MEFNSGFKGLKLDLVLVRVVTRMGKTGLTRKRRLDIKCDEISYYTFRELGTFYLDKKWTCRSFQSVFLIKMDSRED